MIRTTIAALFGVILFLLSGCGCGDRVFTRDLVIVDHRGDDSHYAHPIEVDTSQLGPDAVESRKDGNASWVCYEPHTVIKLRPTVPIKVLIVPASQPSSANTKAARPAG
jgi:hypothetical protein